MGAGEHLFLGVEETFGKRLTSPNLSVSLWFTGRYPFQVWRRLFSELEPIKAWRWCLRSSGHCMPLGVADLSVFPSGFGRAITLAPWMACLNYAWGRLLLLDWLLVSVCKMTWPLLHRSAVKLGVRGGKGPPSCEWCHKCLGKYVWCARSLEGHVSLERQTLVISSCLLTL